jgi:Tol biopolymer transport system component
MSVATPPRRPPKSNSGDRAEIEALREQALIEEARRRARQRRLGNAALALLGLTVAVQAVFGQPGGGHGTARASNRSLLSTQTPINGKLAIADGTGALEVVNADGTGLRTIGRCPPAFARCGVLEPAWSPDGTRLAYVHGQVDWPRGLDTTLGLYVTDADAGHARRLTECGTCGTQFGGTISWSPDSSRIAFSGSDDWGWDAQSLSLWTVDAATGARQQLTSCQPGRCSDSDPDWSPDGQRIAFSRTDKTTSRIYTVRPDGSGLTPITTVGGARHPRWSPDGQTIAFTAHDGLYLVDADGTKPSKRLVAGTAAVPGTLGSRPSVPSWSPDGSKLVYTTLSELTMGTDVWTIGADGSRRRQLHLPALVRTSGPPIWSPDGKQIAFGARTFVRVERPAHFPDRLPISRDARSFGVINLTGVTVWVIVYSGAYTINADGGALKQLYRHNDGQDIYDGAGSALTWQPSR